MAGTSENEHHTAFANSYTSKLDDPTELLDQLYRKYLKVAWDEGE